jgi:hypothetical protein
VFPSNTKRTAWKHLARRHHRQRHHDRDDRDESQRLDVAHRPHGSAIPFVAAVSVATRCEMLALQSGGDAVDDADTDDLILCKLGDDRLQEFIASMARDRLGGIHDGRKLNQRRHVKFSKSG